MTRGLDGQGPHGERMSIGSRLALALSIGLSGLFFLTPDVAVDFWVHLLTGHRILDDLRVPTLDLYNLPYEGTPWVNLNWLFEVVAALIDAIGGFVAINSGKSLLLVSILGLAVLAVPRAARPYLALPFVLAAAQFSSRPYLRPELLSFLFIVLHILILERDRRQGGRILWLTPLVQLLWTNSHGVSIIGFGILGAYGVGALLDGRRLGRGAPANEVGFDPPRRFKRLLGASAIAVLLTPLNPWGLRGALHPFILYTRVSGSDPVFLNIREFRPAFSPEYFFVGTDVRPEALALLLLIVLTAGTSLLNHRRASLPLVLISAAYLVLGLKAQRNVLLFVIPASLLVARNLADLAGGTRLLGTGALGKSLRACGLLVLVLLSVDAAWRGVPATALVSLLEGEKVDGPYPWSLADPHFGELQKHGEAEEAVALVKALPLQGPVLTDFHLACYLIYETYPRYPVYIDSRFDMGGRDHLGSYFELMLHPERELPALQEKYEFELAILRPGTFPSLPLLVHLLHQPLWIPIHEDNEAVVLLRRCEANREVLASLSDLPDGEVLRRRYAGMLGDLSRGPGGG